uniref:Uncharacterized protein n=1 Tax=Picea sitchensis TaxID=3332 RepID=A0A6B9XXC4_PICSI|nr:hypothetical protein Q903MT_gene6721 [Picea sitchensis]
MVHDYVLLSMLLFFYLSVPLPFQLSFGTQL